ncbi:MAG: hypothetical protein EA412_07695 [Chitinophagaceae bacterium]|nr:MAG: hypothetical protein EA412_07695 [Chitinophagaceae bacterium]
MKFFTSYKRIQFVSVILFTLYLSSCTYKDGLFPQKDKEGKFEISIPDFMSSTNRLSEESNFQYQNRYRTIYMVIVDEKKSDSNHSFSSFTEENIQIFENSVDSLLTDSIFNLEINGLNAKQYKADALITGEGFYYSLTFIESETDFYQIAKWTNHKRKKDYESLFDEMALTFRILN